MLSTTHRLPNRAISLLIIFSIVAGMLATMQRLIPTPSAKADGAVETMLFDFETETGTWSPFSGNGTAAISYARTTPGAGDSAGALTFTFDTTTTYAGWETKFAPTADWSGAIGTSQDWSTATGISFWYKGAGTGSELRIEVFDNGATSGSNTTDTAQRWMYVFRDTSTEWRHINAFWSEFVRNPYYQPGGAPNTAEMQLTQVWGIAYLMPGPISSSISVDRLALSTKVTPVENYDGISTGNEEVFSDGVTAVTLTPNPSGHVDSSMVVSYTLSASGWGGGFVDVFPTGQDWSDDNTFDFWFKGSGLGNQIRLDLHDNGAESGDNTPDSSQRFSYFVTDSATTWQLISIPWTEFTRSTAYQPAGAPNTAAPQLTEVWGFSFTPLKPAGHPAATAFQSSFELDEVQVISFAAQVKALPLVEDFEEVSSDWKEDEQNAWGSTLDRIYPGKVGDASLVLTYTWTNNGWNGFFHDFPTSQNWFTNTFGVEYTGIEFWIKSSNATTTYRLDIFDNNDPVNDATNGPLDNNPDSSERFAYYLDGDYTEWTKVSIPFTAFTRSTAYQPGMYFPPPAPNDGFQRTQVWGYLFAPDNAGGDGQLYLDQIKLTTQNFFPELPVVDDFELPRASITNFNGGASVVTQTLVSGRGGNVFQFDYNINDYGGFVHDFGAEGSQDWSGYEAISLWFKGTNTGHNIRLDIHDNGSTANNSPDSAERWAYTITDNSTEWQQLTIPFSSFTRSTAYQPGGAPNNGLTLTEMWGYSFSPPSGVGSFQIDDVVLYENVPAKVQVGAGSYATAMPETPTLPNAMPTVTDNVTGPVPTTDWWTSLAWHQLSDYSTQLYAHPLAFQAKSNGFGVDYPNTPTTTADNYYYNYSEDFTLGVTGLVAPETKVDGWSDWTVRTVFEDAEQVLTATIGHGLPFVFAEASGGDALIVGNGTLVVDNTPGPSVIGFTVGGHHYGAFAPASSQWTKDNNNLQAALSGSDNYFSIAVLPDDSAATLLEFAEYAYNFVTNTTVAWDYDETTSSLNTTYSVTTEAKEGSATGTILALYRHQWLNSSDALTTHTYDSSRGTMKVLKGTGFSTSVSFHGTLPILPDRKAYDMNLLRGYVQDLADDSELLAQPPEPWNTYWYGKAYHRLGQIALVADLFNMPTEEAVFVNKLKSELEDFFTASFTETEKFYYYEPNWGTLLGYPDGFGSVRDMNDHHFHYGYHILAAATLAKLDPTWAEDQNWGGMVNLVIRDVTSPDRNDAMFPFLRTFDPYAGHSWASGHNDATRDANQESSSEAMMYAYSLIMWGMETGRDDIRDLGIYLYATEQEAIEQYWFDIDNVVFPNGFNHSQLAILWSNGGEYRVWWNATDPEQIRGINWLPITAGSLYLGQEPDYINTTWEEMETENGGTPTVWPDTIWPYYSMYDAQAAYDVFEADPSIFGTGGAESRAYSYHWLATMLDVGRVDTNVTANVPGYAVFEKEGVRTYVAYNPGSTLLNVTFSDGMKMRVPAGRLISTFSQRIPLVRLTAQ